LPNPYALRTFCVPASPWPVEPDTRDYYTEAELRWRESPLRFSLG
jgi:hypothetical protein